MKFCNPLAITLAALVTIVSCTSYSNANWVSKHKYDSISAKNKVLTDSLRLLSTQINMVKSNTPEFLAIDSFRVDFELLKTLKTNDKAFGKQEDKLDKFVSAHSYMIRSFIKDGVKYYSIELPSGDTRLYKVN